MLHNIGIYSRAIKSSSLVRGVRFSSTSAPKMNWVDFFKLRKQNRYLNNVASGITAFGGAFATLTYLGNFEIDVEKPIFGFDPFMVLGGCLLLGGMGGYLLGPFLGTAVFNLRSKAVLQQFKEKEVLFLLRVRRYRADPSSQSFSNPVPDYYGEKIYSLQNYKQWLRDCNAFRRKAKEFL